MSFDRSILLPLALDVRNEESIWLSSEHLGWFQRTNIENLRLRSSSFDPDRFGLLLSDFIDSNKTELFDKLYKSVLLFVYYRFPFVYPHYEQVMNTSL